MFFGGPQNSCPIFPTIPLEALPRVLGPRPSTTQATNIKFGAGGLLIPCPPRFNHHVLTSVTLLLIHYYPSISILGVPYSATGLIGAASRAAERTEGDGAVRRLSRPSEAAAMEEEETTARSRRGGTQSQVLKVLEALKEASRNLQKGVNGDTDLKALLELETESDLFSFDPYLSTLSHHLSQLKDLVQDLRKKTTPTLRSLLRRRSSSRDISRVASSIETDIQSWIDRENVQNLVDALRSASASPREKEKLLLQFERRVSQGFDRELQNVLLKSGVFHVLESVLCDSSPAEKMIRERAGSAIAALAQFNKDVFVGQVLMGPTIKSLISLASVDAIRVLCSLTRSIKSPLADDFESNGHIPKIMCFLASDDIAVKIQAMELVMEIGYFGRKEAIEAMIEEGVVEKLLEMQRSELGGNLIDMGRFEDENYSEEKIGDAGGHEESKKKSRENKFLEKHPFASCVARFSIQLEVGQGLRQSEKRAFKQEILKRVKEASASDTEAANILAEVLWGASPW